MGMDLKIIPTHKAKQDSEFSMTVIEFKRDYDLFEEIRKIERERGHNGKIAFYFEHLSYSLETDAYGENMSYVFAEEFNKIELKNISPVNEGIMAFLAKLEPKHPIYLYWN